MPINFFDLAGHKPNLFEHEPFNIFGSIKTVLLKQPKNDWNNPIVHAEPETPKPCVEYFRQSAIKCELLTIDDPVFKVHWKEYHFWADKWKCWCTEEYNTEWCYCDDTKSSAKFSQW